MSKNQRLVFVLAGLAAVLFAPPALAADAGSLDRIIDLYKNGASGWEGVLLSKARALFAILVGIEVAWTLIRLGMKNADMGEFAAEMVNRIMFVGFFGWLLTNSGAFARAIVNSFRQAGDAAATSAGGAGGVRPSDLFDAGLQMATMVMQAKVDMSLEGVGQAVALMIAAVVICVCFALMGAFLIIALVESYIVTSAGVILMGFGGSRWTKDFALKGITYAVSVGAKLFMIQLIAGLGESVIKAQAAAVDPASAQKPEDVLVMVGFGIVMLALTKTIPDTVQGLINGVSTGNAGGNIVAGTVGGMVGAGVGQALGAGSAVGNSYRLASQQLSGGEGGSKPGFGSLTSRALQNLGGAAASDMGARLAGHSRHGTMGGRMGHSMAREAREASRENAKPAPPAVSGGNGSPIEGVIRPAAGMDPAPVGAGAPASAAASSASGAGTSGSSGSSFSASGASSATADPATSAEATLQASEVQGGPGSPGGQTTVRSAADVQGEEPANRPGSTIRSRLGGGSGGGPRQTVRPTRSDPDKPKPGEGA